MIAAWASFKAGSRIRYGCKFGEKVLLRGKSIGSPFHQIYNRTLFLNQPYFYLYYYYLLILQTFGSKGGCCSMMDYSPQVVSMRGGEIPRSPRGMGWMSKKTSCR